MSNYTQEELEEYASMLNQICAECEEIQAPDGCTTLDAVRLIKADLMAYKGMALRASIERDYNQ